jgi:hypothetical protein
LIRTTKRYSSNESSGTAGSTVSSKGGFSDKEKAVENQWARTHVSKKKKRTIKWDLWIIQEVLTSIFFVIGC